jgi:hypothetical protein
MQRDVRGGPLSSGLSLGGPRFRAFTVIPRIETMKRLVALLAICVLAPAAALAGKAPDTAATEPTGSKLMNLSSSRMLSLWEQPPEYVQQLYDTCFKILSAKPGATFADVAADETVQRICREHSITHLGGPMLGCIGPDGAKVWLRTCRPAKVEVRVTVGGAEKTFGPVESTAETDLAAVVPVTGLAPASRVPTAPPSGRPRRGRRRPPSASPSARAPTGSAWATGSRPRPSSAASRPPCCSTETWPSATATTASGCTGPTT